MSRSVLTVATMLSVAALLGACGEGDTTTVIREAPIQQEPEAVTTTVTEQETQAQPASAAEPEPAPETEATGGAVPDVVGERLDIAKQQVRDAGLGTRTVGGGVFGVLVDRNWVVCSQEPGGGSSADAGTRVDLSVDRTC